MEKPKPRVVEKVEKVEVWLPLCRRVAGKIVCEEKGIKVMYKKSPGGIEGPICIERGKERPRRPGRPKRLIKRTLIYERGTVGPIEIEYE